MRIHWLWAGILMLASSIELAAEPVSIKPMLSPRHAVEL